MQSWGDLIWGGTAEGAGQLMGTRNAAALRQIPGLTLETAMTLRNWMYNEPAQNATAQARWHLLNEIIGLLGGH